MQFTTTTFFALLAASLSVIPAMAQSTPSVLNYDTMFDSPSGTLGMTACPADGILEGHPTFGSLPTFPYIGGAYFVQGFNSSRCGSCYELSYKRSDGKVATRTYTIINTVDHGFTSSLAAAMELTGLSRDEFPGDAAISAKEVPVAHCGL